MMELVLANGDAIEVHSYQEVNFGEAKGGIKVGIIGDVEEIAAKINGNTDEITVASTLSGSGQDAIEPLFHLLDATLSSNVEKDLSTGEVFFTFMPSDIKKTVKSLKETVSELEELVSSIYEATAELAE
jgi:hypothetical protein